LHIYLISNSSLAAISVIGNMDSQKFEDIVKNDYNFMLDNVRLCTSEQAKELLLMQSIEGHATEGHGCFRNRRKKERYIFPDAAIEDVVAALGFSPERIKEERQRYIDEIYDFVGDVIIRKKKISYVNRSNSPLFGIDFLGSVLIQSPENFLVGFYLGSRMDNYLQWRSKIEAEQGIKIGGGECIGVNRKIAKQRGISLESIANDAHSAQDVEMLVSEGVLCREVKSTPEIVSGYVRYAEGEGTSDDLAVLLAGRLYGRDAAIGVFLADAVDTWDKYVPFIKTNGQDEALGDIILANAKKIRQNYGIDLPSESEVKRFIGTISCCKFPDGMISNSQRYFLQIDDKTGISAIESHLGYIEGKKPPKMQIGHVNSGMTNNKMYRQFEAAYLANYK